MLTREILSLQHSFIKHLVKLHASKAYRYEHMTTFVIGSKLVNEFKPKIILTEKDSNFSVAADEQLVVSKQIMRKITGQSNPEGIVGVVTLPQFKILFDKNRLIAFDGVQDPGNLGTLIRSALALGFEGGLLLPGTADPFQDKVICSSKGASLRFPLMQTTWDEIKSAPHTTYLADIEGSHNTKYDEMLILVMGNEGKGLSPEAEGTKVTIPIQGVESLNVAAAGSILMHQIRGSLCPKTT